MFKTVKLHITNVSDEQNLLLKKRETFGYAYRHCAKAIDELADVNSIAEIKQKFGLVDVEFRSIKAKVVSDRKGHKENLKDQHTFLESLKQQLEQARKELSQTKLGITGIKTIKRNIFHLIGRIGEKETALKKEKIVYGQRVNLEKITYLWNSYNSSECEFEKARIKKQIDKTTEIYKAKRLGNIYLLGEANQKANRFFDFNLSKKEIIYKPRGGEKVIFQVKIGKNRIKEMMILEELAKKKDISITVEIIDGHICLQYDSQILYGYNVDKQGRNLEVKDAKAKKLTKKAEENLIKQIYKEFFNKQDDTKVIGKIRNRFIGIDLNPDCIGYTIIDKISDDKFKIIKCGSFHIGKELTRKLGKASSSKKQKWQNDKRKHEIKEVLLAIFEIASHYRCYNFVMEELNFKSEVSDGGQEFNRKTKNIWHRELITEMINKKVGELGMNLIEISPVLTSFIGNVMYKVFDAAAASIEITRRGTYKFTKGKFYPNIDGTILRSMQQQNIVVGDVVGIKDITWKSLFATTTQKVGYRYRWGESIGLVDSHRSKSHKSFTRHNTYYCA